MDAESVRLRYYLGVLQGREAHLVSIFPNPNSKHIHKLLADTTAPTSLALAALPDMPPMLTKAVASTSLAPTALPPMLTKAVASTLLTLASEGEHPLNSHSQSTN